MKHFVKSVEFINSKIGVLASYIILITSFILVYEVLARHYFGAPTIWAHDISTYAFGIYSVYGGAYALYRNAHVGVDVFTRGLRGKTKAILEIVTSLIVFLFLLILLRYVGEHMLISVGRLEYSRTAFSIPVWPLKIITFIGIVLFMLQSVSKLTRNLYFAVAGREIS